MQNKNMHTIHQQMIWCMVAVVHGFFIVCVIKHFVADLSLVQMAVKGSVIYTSAITSSPPKVMYQVYLVLFSIIACFYCVKNSMMVLSPLLFYVAGVRSIFLHSCRTSMLISGIR